MRDVQEILPRVVHRSVEESESFMSPLPWSVGGRRIRSVEDVGKSGYMIEEIYDVMI